MNSNKQLFKNLLTSGLTSVIAFGLSFFLSPFITKTLGVEANGFVTLANQFVGYISIISIALTSMASRFISISVFRNDYQKANEYFNSEIGASLLLCIILAIPLSLIVNNINSIISVSDRLLSDVKILFGIVFLNFLLGIIFGVFSIATYVTNKLYLSSLRSIEGQILRCVFIILAYYAFEARMYYVSIGALLSALYTYVWNMYYTKKFLPQMVFGFKYFKFKAIAELVSAGSWNIILQLNNILNTGLDLLLSNLILGEYLMGILAVAKAMPTAISSLLGSVSVVFLPEMTERYAEGDMNGLTTSIKRSIKILGLVFNIPVVFLISFGVNFYTLWQPSLDSYQLQILSILTIFTILVSGSTATVFGIFTITNRLRFHSLTSLVFGALNVVIVIGLLQIVPSNVGVYYVAGVSSALITIRNYVITFPYAAKCVNQKWYVFHIPSLKTILGATVASVICYGIRMIYSPNSWLTLIIAGIVTSLVTIILNYSLLFDINDRKHIRSMTRNIIMRRADTK